jgi:hypothetical protein
VKGIQEELKMTKSFVLIGFAVAAITGCSGAIRIGDAYRDDVAKLLASKDGDVKACYDGVLKDKKDLAGKVTVHFAVEKETGVLKDIKTDGPAELGTCVSGVLNGLTLTPPDSNNGDATFVYEFTVGAPAAS